MTKRLSLATVAPEPARGLGWLCSALFLALGASGTHAEQLLTDPAFTRGVRVVAPTEGNRIEGVLQPGSAHLPPAWRLVQWTSRTSVAGAAPEPLPGGGVRFASETKAVTFGPSEGERQGVGLLMRGGNEYGARLRKPEEPWLTSINLGWELTGPLDVEMHFRNLSLEGNTGHTGKR